MAEYEITVVDTNPTPFPGATDLVLIGVPVQVAAQWRRLRWHFTVGLRRLVAETPELMPEIERYLAKLTWLPAWALSTLKPPPVHDAED